MSGVEVLLEHLATIYEIWIFGHKVHGPRALELCRATIRKHSMLLRCEAICNHVVLVKEQVVLNEDCVMVPVI
jgi:hypothetical protein